MRTRSGTVSQSGLRHEESDYGHERITHPVLGIVLNVFESDHNANRSSHITQDLRGSQLEARVLVVNDGTDSPWIIPNAVITSCVPTGVDNYHEEIPRGVTGTVDESKLESNYTNTSPQKLDGDWCVVDFIGGSINQPFIAHWWPHPANRRDPATSGRASNSLQQGRRSVKRFQGTRFTVTSKGTVLMDTSEANHVVKKGRRQPSQDGGDVRLTMKENRQLEVNFNPSVYGDPAEDDFLWPPDRKDATRATTSTKLTVNKDLIEYIAGEVIKLVAQRMDIVLSTPNGKQQLGEGADEPLVLGNRWRATMEQLINTALTQLQVPTAWGPSGPASGIPTNVTNFNQVVSRLPDDLSDFVFTKKTPA